MKNRFDLELASRPPEHRFLIACLRASWQGEAGERSNPRDLEPMDWKAFMWWVNRHRVAPLVYRGMGRLNQVRVPEEIRRGLKEKAEGNLRRNMFLTAEVVRLAALFQKRGVPVIPFKGVILAWKLYDGFGLRYVGDIDLLVSPSQAEQAGQFLHEAGYQGSMPDFEGSPRQLDLLKRTIRDKDYLKPGSGTKVELHWRLSHYRYVLPLDFEKLMGRSRSLSIAGQSVPVFSDEDMWLHLFEHGASHAWFRLFWLCDVAALLYREPDTDWVRLVARARELNVVRPMIQGVMLAHLLLGAPVPAPIRTLAERDPAAPYLVRTALRHIWMPEPIHLLLPPQDGPHPRRHAWRRLSKIVRMTMAYETKLHSGFRHKLDVLRGVAALRPADWSLVRLPPPLFPLYYLLRPVLWVWRRLIFHNTIE